MDSSINASHEPAQCGPTWLMSFGGFLVLLQILATATLYVGMFHMACKLVEFLFFKYAPAKLVSAVTDPKNSRSYESLIFEYLLDRFTCWWRTAESVGPSGSGQKLDVSWSEWTRWKEEFAVNVGTDFNNEPDQVKKDKFIRSLDAFSCVLDKVGRDGDYNAVFNKAEYFFINEKKILKKRVDFDDYRRNESESIDDMVKALKKLSTECNLKISKEEVDKFICVRIMANLDPFIRDKILEEGIFSLDKTISAAKLMEYAKQQNVSAQQNQATQQMPSLSHSHESSSQSSHSQLIQNGGTPRQQLVNYIASAVPHFARLFSRVRENPRRFAADSASYGAYLCTLVQGIQFVVSLIAQNEPTLAAN